MIAKKYLVCIDGAWYANEYDSRQEALNEALRFVSGAYPLGETCVVKTALAVPAADLLRPHAADIGARIQSTASKRLAFHTEGHLNLPQLDSVQAFRLGNLMLDWLEANCSCTSVGTTDVELHECTSRGRVES